MHRVAAQLLRLVVVVLAVTFASFALLDLLPGDAADVALGSRSTEEGRAEVRAELGLDRPMVVRYGTWLGDAVTGDLGRSYRTNQPVSEAIGERIGLTVQLVVLSQLLALALAVPLALVAASRPGSLRDRSANAAALAMLATPAYVVAVGLVAVLSVRLGWFPTSGFTRWSDGAVDHLRTLVLPVVALAIPEVAIYLRILRAELIATLQQDYISFARATGAPERRVLIRHALRPSSLGLITVAGVTIGRMLGGTVMVESIFGLPGLGRFTVDAINGRDFVALQGAVVVFAVGFVILNVVVDETYSLLDPRTRR